MTKKFVLVKFTAPWCGPCRAFGPIVKRFLVKHPEVSLVEYDLTTKLGERKAKQYGVQSIPQLYLKRGRRTLSQLNGGVSLAGLENWFVKGLK